VQQEFFDCEISDSSVRFDQGVDPQIHSGRRASVLVRIPAQAEHCGALEKNQDQRSPTARRVAEIVSGAPQQS
jgi:hypothetical protein